MDNNYYYIIAGLPDLVFSEDNKNFTYDSVRNPIYSLLSSKDRRLVDWLEYGFDDDHLQQFFYSKAINHKNSFIKNYYLIDLIIRECRVQHISSSDKSKAKYSLGLNVAKEYGGTLKTEINAAMSITNIIDRELEIDKLKWSQYNVCTTFDYFNINIILAFLAKARIIERWCLMDKSKGAELFKKFVDEVRGTFKGLDNKEIK